MIIILNNKCNLSKEEFIEYQETLKTIKSPYKMVLAPTFLNINLFDLENFNLASQNISAFNEGAHTGEISGKDLKKSNVTYSLIGHSERRKDQRETNRDIQEKIKRALENDIIPVLCIGETKSGRQSNRIEEVIKKDIIEATCNLTEEEIKKIIIAYEPIWSIGTGLIPKNKDIEKVNKLIKKILPNNTIIYGGSANEENIDLLKKCSSIEGYLLGGLSLHPDKLQKFINKI